MYTYVIALLKMKVDTADIEARWGTGIANTCVSQGFAVHKNMRYMLVNLSNIRGTQKDM